LKHTALIGDVDLTVVKIYSSSTYGIKIMCISRDYQDEIAIARRLHECKIIVKYLSEYAYGIIRRNEGRHAADYPMHFRIVLHFHDLSLRREALQCKTFNVKMAAS
jgi:hypothetical protein